MAIRKKESMVPEAALDMTPIIDSVFLLLIFFMVTTVFKNPSQLKMTLPDAMHPKKLDQKQITIEISGEGVIAVQGQQVTLDQVDAYLLAEKQKTQCKSVVIRADKDAKHGDILKLMKLAKGAQMETIAMAVDDLSQKEGGASR